MSEKHIKNTVINFGPQHPAAHGVLRLVLELDGELVQRAEPHIGLLHRGTEKLMENKTYLQALPYLDRLDYVSPLAYEHGFVLAIEKLLNANVPIRAQYIRVLLLELTRINNHLFVIGASALDAGAMTPFVWAMEEREKIIEIFEKVSGARFHMNYFRPGGVAKDIPQQVFEDIKDFLEQFKPNYKDTLDLLLENRIFKQRSVDISVVPKEKALDYGFTGPNLRASGVAWDLRKAQPCEVYSRLDFDVICCENGDNYDRVLVRVAEIEESIKIINQCIDQIPDGPVKTDDYKVAPPLRADMKTSMEALIHHFKIFSEGIVVPKGSTYVGVEAPSGEFGVYLVSDGSNKPYRVKLRATGFAHLQVLKYLMPGYQLADVPATLGTLDVVFGEIDR